MLAKVAIVGTRLTEHALVVLELPGLAAARAIIVLEAKSKEAGIAVGFIETACAPCLAPSTNNGKGFEVALEGNASRRGSINNSEICTATASKAIMINVACETVVGTI